MRRCRGPKAIPVHKGNEDHRVSVVLKVHPDRQARKGIRDPRVSQVLRDRKVKKEIQVRKVLQVRQERRVRRVILERPHRHSGKKARLEFESRLLLLVCNEPSCPWLTLVPAAKVASEARHDLLC